MSLPAALPRVPPKYSDLESVEARQDCVVLTASAYLSLFTSVLSLEKGVSILAQKQILVKFLQSDLH